MLIVVAYLIVLCQSKIYVTLAFDDGYTEHLSVGQVLKDRYNFPATFFINSGRLGNLSIIILYSTLTT